MEEIGKVDKHHSKKAILKLTLITTSILLMHSNQVNAEEQELKNQEQSPVIANVAQQPSPSVTTNTVEKTSVTAASASNTAKEMGDTSVKNDKTEDELLEELSKNLDTSNLGADLEEEYPSKPETTNNKESNVVTNASTAIAQKVPSAYEEVKPESKSSLAVLDTSKIDFLRNKIWYNSSMNYEASKQLTDVRFKRLVGVQRTTFEEMLAVLKTAYQRKHAKGGRTPKLSLEDLLMATLQYMREYRTYEQIAADFGIHESNLIRRSQWVESTLIQSGFTISKTHLSAEDTVIVDATEVKINRPKKIN